MLKETLETFFTPTEQSLLFLYSALLGVGLSLVYDVFRVFRAIIPHTSFLVAFEDIVFCLIWGLALFVFSMELSRGEVRGFFFVGNILGFALCHFTLGNIFVNAIRKIVFVVKRFLLFLYRIFVQPIVKLLMAIYQKVTHIFVNIYSKFKKSKNNRKIHLKPHTKMLYNDSTHKKSRRLVKKDVNRIEKSRRRKKKKRADGAFM